MDQTMTNKSKISQLDGLELIFEPKYSINQTTKIPKKIRMRQKIFSVRDKSGNTQL